MNPLLIYWHNSMLRYIVPFFASLVISLGLTPLVRRMAVKYKFVVFPKRDRWRMRVVASLGGISMFAAAMIPYLFLSNYDLTSMGFIFGALGIFWLGLIDDLVNIKADTKLIGQIIIACIAVMFGLKFNISPNPLVNISLTIFWLVGIMNAFNLLDNMDGLCAGIACIASLTLGVHSAITGSAQPIILPFLILGSALGFLKYNFSPAKIFMGDCGSMFLGYSLAAAALMGAVKEKSGLLITLAIPVFVLAVPIFDTIFVTLSRSMNNKAISEGGKDHTSHRLVTLGLSEKNAVLLLYAISAACGLISLLYTRLTVVYVMILLAVMTIGLFMFGVFLGSEAKVYSEEELTRLSKKKKLNGTIVLNGFIYNKRRIVEVALDFVIISISYIAAYLLRFEGVLLPQHTAFIVASLPVILIVKLIMFYAFGLYRGVWRYAGLYDVLAIFQATSLGSLVSVGIIVALKGHPYGSKTVFMIDWLMTFVLVSGARILFRLYKEFFANMRPGQRRVLIFGAGDAGELVLREIRNNRELAYKPVGFIDDDKGKLYRIIHGVKVLGTGRELEGLLARHRIDELVLAIPAPNRKRMAEIYEVCDKAKVPYREISKIIPIKKEGISQ